MATTSKKQTTLRSTRKVPTRNRSNVVPGAPFISKTDHVIGMLRRKEGASIAEIVAIIGWQEHSVRALLTATIAKKRKLPLVKGKQPGEETRYYVAALRSAEN